MKEQKLYERVVDEMNINLSKIESEHQRRKEIKLFMNKKNSRKKIIASCITAAACISVICTPVFASGIGEVWNRIIADIYGVDNKTEKQYSDTNLMKDYSAESLNSISNITSEDNGTSVSLVQTIADDYQLSVYLNVKTDGQTKLSGDHLFEETKVYVDGEVFEGFESSGYGFVDDDHATSDTERMFELSFLNSKGIDLEGKNITVKMKNLQVNIGKLEMKTVVEGNWELSWNATGQYKGETISVDLKNTRVSDFILKDMTLSPITANINYEYLGEKFTDSEPLHIVYIMKDGSENEIDSGGSESKDYRFNSFTKVLNLEEVQSVKIDGVEFQIER